MSRTASAEEQERWRPIAGYEGFYEVSDLGRIRSIERRVGLQHRYGDSIRHKRRSGEMIPTPDRNGRLQICLSRDGRVRYFGVARLVLDTFGNPVPPDCLVVHRDDDKGNCAFVNLTWRPRGRARPSADAPSGSSA